ncbi:fructoselysine 6-kinase [Anaerocolumna xylanovorans]|uniref:Fructoselysine 6-kinase n=1 Tax=Anaerocolumna xylanovorans DSM 12503 TaxID=1121345 RepID=A0A1M7XYW2_9FIRM|nr:fructoselysine 6-kinase [Anaerocolumna xylanovorans]SHO44246.1 fructoselysine 6-kinase [Anaerocolumna xylanovorans DSM 12503]
MSEEKLLKIAAVGDNCIDAYQNLNQAFPGGNPVNVAVYSVRLGGNASYTGVVGDDEYGQIMINALKEKGVDTSHIRVLPGKTAVTQVELVNGERIFGDYDEGVLADFKLTQEDIEFLCSHDIVVSGLWGMIENDLYKIKAKGTPIAFDFATKFEDPVVEKAVPWVDYAFFASDDKDTKENRDFLKEMYKKGPKLVVMTLGEQGSIAYDGNSFYQFGIIKCEVKDTMGAGDSYIAGFLRGLLLGKSIEECMEAGAGNSSVTLQYTGAW